MLPCISVLPNVRTFKHLQCFLSTGVVLYFVICCTWHYQYRLKIGLLVGEVLCHCIRSFYILPQHQAAFHLSYPWKYGSTVVACIFFPNIAKIFCHENDGGSQSIQGPLQSIKLWPGLIYITIFGWYLQLLEITVKIFCLRTAVYESRQFHCFYESNMKSLRNKHFYILSKFHCFLHRICQHNVFSCLLSLDWAKVRAIMNGPGNLEVTLCMWSQRQQYP